MDIPEEIAAVMPNEAPEAPADLTPHDLFLAGKAEAVTSGFLQMARHMFDEYRADLDELVQAGLIEFDFKFSRTEKLIEILRHLHDTAKTKNIEE